MILSQKSIPIEIATIDALQKNLSARRAQDDVTEVIEIAKEESGLRIRNGLQTNIMAGTTHTAVVEEIKGLSASITMLGA